MMQFPNTVPLPRREFYAYSVGYTGPMTLMSLVNVLLVNYYTFVLGLDALSIRTQYDNWVSVIICIFLVFRKCIRQCFGVVTQKWGRPTIHFPKHDSHGNIFHINVVSPIETSYFWRRGLDCGRVVVG